MEKTKMFKMPIEVNPESLKELMVLHNLSLEEVIGDFAWTVKEAVKLCLEQYFEENPILPGELGEKKERLLFDLGMGGKNE